MHADLVTPIALGVVQRVVSSLDQLLVVGAVRRHLGNTQADGKGNDVPIMADPLLFDRYTQAFGKQAGLLEATVW